MTTLLLLLAFLFSFLAWNSAAEAISAIRHYYTEKRGLAHAVIETSFFVLWGTMAALSLTAMIGL